MECNSGRYERLANQNAYVVITKSFGLGHDGETSVERVFSSEEKAKKFIDNAVLDWLKNQKTFDPTHSFSGVVEYGNNDDNYYVMIDVMRDNDNEYTRWFAYDYYIFDYEK